MAMLWGWSLGGGLVLGLCLSVASTVVLLKALEERNAVATLNGRIAVGWLIVEDLAMVLVLVLLPALAGMLGGNVPGGGHGAPEHGLLLTLAITLAKVAAFGAIVLLVGPRVLPWILRQVARTGSRELFTLAILSLSVGIAFGAAELFGVSFALGAFFAGVVLNESDLSHKAATNSLPLQDAFAVLFFVRSGCCSTRRSSSASR
jgi:CPA2 family monovalent cation:H+ antiporter-2